MRNAVRSFAEQKKPRIAGLDSFRILQKQKSRPRIERHTKAESLLPHCALCAFEGFGDARSPSLFLREGLQGANIVGRPRTALC
jgi:hypothetical protein